MAKALKPLIIILLILSFTSLILGIVLFSKREILKGRALRSEAGLVAVAEKIRFDGLDTTKLASYTEMQGELDKLAAAADNTYEDLQNTKTDLDTIKTELDQTATDLAASRKQLEQREDDVRQLNQKVAQKDADLDTANSTIEQLDQDKTGLQGQINDLNDKLAQAEDASRDLQDMIVTLEQAVKDLENEIGSTGRISLPKGTSGKVLVVNKDWNFVVLDIGSEKGLVPKAEMLVHREDKLIGKVAISAVSKTLAIAEIVSDWEQTPLREGDYVVY
ncbi:MAG: hypothetical protein V1929_00645 [bacterium]